MARDWPAQDIAPLIALIDDPRHGLSEDGTIRMSEEQARRSSTSASSVSPRSAAMRSATS